MEKRNKEDYEEDEDPYSEYSLLSLIEDKFNEISKWTKQRSIEMKKEMFDLVDDMNFKNE